jgi:hypothetical protein
MGDPQRLHVMRTLRPLTFSSGIPYLAGQLVHATFIGVVVAVAHRERFDRV